MNLSPKDSAFGALYSNCLFRSDTRAEAHDLVARELAEHHLQWKRGLADAAMYMRQLRRLKIYVLQYGAEVEVTPRPFEGFSLVHTSLTGGTEIEADGERVHVAEGRTAILSPQRRIGLRWHPGTVQLLLRVPHDLVHEVLGRPRDLALHLAPAVLVPTRWDAQWSLIARSILNALTMQDSTHAHLEWVDHFERNVVLFLLAQQPQGHHELPLTAADADAENTSGHQNADRRMRAMMAYMEPRLCAPLSLGDLARATGVSLRTLNDLCHHHHGMSPMELLRAKRLDAVHKHLLLHPEAQVSETAMAFGFGHLGRFASYYKDRFGELPRQTVAQAGGGPPTEDPVNRP
ncbi:AraC family transcriptional regulator [Hydrogenophaga sp. OTU3427]|uniref:AraC family transcriptional regulator n=1 Tax=Hydrogenophaga sp. OTU3427 TaxID=3043856 RepID=UPI00313ECE85